MFKKYILYKEGIDVNYTLPSNPEEQMADFYCILLLDSTNFTLDNFGEMDRNDLLKYEIKITKKQLLESLKPVLLNDLLKCIALELKHFGDCSYHKHEEKNSFELQLIEKSDDLEVSLEKKSLSIMFDIINKFFSNNVDFIKYAKKMFTDIRWKRAYGGKTWGLICDAWLKLYYKNGDTSVEIDHIYDLEHNTGQIFTKLDRYHLGNYYWIQYFLDKKKDLIDVKELLNLISPKMKSLSLRVLNFDKSKIKNEDLFHQADGNTSYDKITKVLIYNEIKNSKTLEELLNIIESKNFKIIINNVDGLIKKYNLDKNEIFSKYINYIEGIKDLLKSKDLEKLRYFSVSLNKLAYLIRENRNIEYINGFYKEYFKNKELNKEKKEILARFISEKLLFPIEVANEIVNIVL